MANTATLVRYTAACRAVQLARSVDEAKAIRDSGEALRAYGRVAKNRSLEIDGAEIRLRAERRVGELISAQKETVGLARGGEHGGKRRLDGSRSAPSKVRPTLAEAGISKKLSSHAQRLAAVPTRQFEQMVGDWRDRVSRETERITTILIREDERRRIRIARPPVPLPEGRFRLILADPAWSYEQDLGQRSVKNKYPTMTLEEICAMPVTDLAAPDAVLFLWSPSPKLAEAMAVIAAWGFVYRTCAIWDKLRIGLGFYFRSQHELLLVAARGQAPIPDTSRRYASVIRSRRTAHSEKPHRVYELLEAMYPDFTAVDRVELFGRGEARKGWTVSSNEPRKMVAASSC